LNTKDLTQNRHLLCLAEQDQDFLPVEILNQSSKLLLKIAAHKMPSRGNVSRMIYRRSSSDHS